MKLRQLFFPEKCVGCGELLADGDGPLCAHCLALWEFAKLCCRDENAGVPVKIYSGTLRDAEVAGSVLHAVDYLPGRHELITNKLIMRLKTRGDAAVVDFIADELAVLIAGAVPSICAGGERQADAVISWIPRQRAAVQERGFDHMKRVARAVSRKLKIPARPLLRRRIFSGEQKHLSAAGRRENANRTIVASRYQLDGKIVLLLDDIVTTGASLEAGAWALLDRSAEQVIAATLSATRSEWEHRRRIEDNFIVTKPPKNR